MIGKSPRNFEVFARSPVRHFFTSRSFASLRDTLRILGLRAGFVVLMLSRVMVWLRTIEKGLVQNKCSKLFTSQISAFSIAPSSIYRFPRFDTFPSAPVCSNQSSSTAISHFVTRHAQCLECHLRQSVRKYHIIKPLEFSGISNVT